MHTRRWLSGTLAVCALGAGLYAYQRAPADVSEPAAARQTSPRPAPPSRQARPPPPQAPRLPVPEEAPLNTRIERLLATRKPEDAYRAYWLVADCAAFNLNGDRIVFDQEEIAHAKPLSLPGFRAMTDEEKRHDAKLCGGMTERERQSRLDYLAMAARAGVPGAAVNFATEGPFGDPSALQTRPSDPLVQAWKATAIAQLTQGAESGADPSAIQYLIGAYGSGAELMPKDPLLAYRYFVALRLIDEDILGPDDSLSKIIAGQRRQAGAMVQDFSPEQRAAEYAAARRIADLAKARREQAARKPAPGN